MAAAKQADRINSDKEFAGNVTFVGNVTLPGGVVRDANIPALANISADKVQQKHHSEYRRAGNATTETVPMHVCRGATGLVIDFGASYIGAPTGTGNVTIRLQKAGVNIDASALTLDIGTGARAFVASTLLGGGNLTLAQGDQLDAVITANAGNGTVPSGLYLNLRVKEDPV